MINLIRFWAWLFLVHGVIFAFVNLYWAGKSGELAKGVPFVQEKIIDALGIRLRHRVVQAVVAASILYFIH